MNILVCVKQVPNVQTVSVDSSTHCLVREGMEGMLNPCDAYALEAATRLQDKDKRIKIHVLSMGPPQAEAVLRECLAISADAAYLATDECFAGSDTLATSQILSACIQKAEATEGISFDMVFCGQQAMDGGTGHTGPQIAEALGLPYIGGALSCKREGEELHVLREAEEGKEKVGVTFPCLVSFTKSSFPLRLASIRRKLAAKKAEIKRMCADDLEGLPRTSLGLAGASTKVQRTFIPEEKRGGILFAEGSLEESARRFAHRLMDDGVLRAV